MKAIWSSNSVVVVVVETSVDSNNRICLALVYRLSCIKHVMSNTGYLFASQVLLQVIGQSIRRQVGFLFTGGMIYNVQNLSSSL